MKTFFSILISVICDQNKLILLSGTFCPHGMDLLSVLQNMEIFCPFAFGPMSFCPIGRLVQGTCCSTPITTKIVLCNDQEWKIENFCKHSVFRWLRLISTSCDYLENQALTSRITQTRIKSVNCGWTPLFGFLMTQV